jgi:hypothetical protein
VQGQNPHAVKPSQFDGSAVHRSSFPRHHCFGASGRPSQKRIGPTTQSQRQIAGWVPDALATA